MMHERIFKVQLPISSSDKAGMEKALVYDEEQAIKTFVPVSQVRQWFKEGELKVYLRGHSLRGRIFFEERVEDRDW